MTLTQLGAFVLVARLGSVRAAAEVLGVSEPAVSQALAALRRHFDDDLITRAASGMALTPGGQRLMGIASQMVGLGAEAESAVRAAQGAPERLRVVATSEIAELVAPSLLEEFSARIGGVETSLGVATTAEMPVLLQSRLADVALGPPLDPAGGVESTAVMRCHLVVVAAPSLGPAISSERLAAATWLVDPCGADPDSPVAELLAAWHVPEHRIQVFPSQTAAWAAAASGLGVAPAIAHLVEPELRQGRLRRIDLPGVPLERRWHLSSLMADRRPRAAGAFQHFAATPQGMQLMHKPGQGVPPSRFRPPVYVTIWS
ncbi:MAG TPA: LysR family transcriptional regulator [Acidimicrobiales bacterium]